MELAKETLLGIAHELDQDGSLGLVKLAEDGSLITYKEPPTRGIGKKVGTVLLWLPLLLSETNNILKGAMETSTPGEVASVVEHNLKLKYYDAAVEDKQEIQHVISVVLKHMHTQLDK
jgi:hypothetical protein